MSLHFARLLTLLAAVLTAAGWGLSALHALHGAGYAWVLGFGLAAWLAWWPPRFRRPSFRWRRRFRRPLPAAFAGLFLLVLLSGCLYAPSNYDALAYRLPRVLAWLGAHQWHWLDTDFVQLNTRPSVTEWLSAPVLLLWGSARPLWLLNAACWAALPGLLYAIGGRWGVRRRVMYAWMWLLPTGWVFLLQAGGIANDLPATFLVLAALALALRGEVLLSLLAAALATGVKLSTAPLLLPWALAVWPHRRALWRRPLRLAAALLLAAVCSGLPHAVLNARHGGDWTGASQELGPALAHSAHLPRVAGNALGLAVQNLTPPVFPLAGAWNRWAEGALPAGFRTTLAYTFEGQGRLWLASELPYEDYAPFGLTLLLLLGAAVVGRGRTPQWRWVPWSPWLAFGVFLWQMNLLAVGRLAAPYYLLLPLPLLARSGLSFRHAVFRGLAGLHLATAALVLALAPSRPLWPALSLLARMPPSPAVLRARTVYATYRQRPWALAPVRALLPPGVARCGLLTTQEPVASLWWPVGRCTWVHCSTRTTGAALRAQGLEWCVVSEGALGAPLAGWLASHHAQVAASLPLTVRASGESTAWHVVRLLPSSAPAYVQP